MAGPTSRSRLPDRHRPVRRSLTLLAAALLTALAVTSCGGGDGIRIEAITSTPGAGASGTAEATSTPTETPTETVPVPDEPENPFAGGRLVEAYLAGGDPDLEGCLPQLVARWEMAPAVDGERCLSLDLDGDRRDEYVFVVSYAQGPDDESPYPADLWFFQDAEEDRRFYNSARALANAATAGLRLRHAEDLTSDGLPELVITWLECGAHTCVTHLTIASYHNGTLEDLAPDDATVETLEEFEVAGGEVRMRGGMIGSVGAGPQRESTTVVRWAGSRFRTETEEGEPQYLVHAVNDADALYDAGDYAAAREAYLEVAENTTLPEWKPDEGVTPERAELQAYSVFRAAMAAFRLDDPAGARSLLSRASSGYPQTMHGSAAQQYLFALDEGRTPAQACSIVEDFVDTFRDLYVEFWNYGYANPERTVFTLCR